MPNDTEILQWLARYEAIKAQVKIANMLFKRAMEKVDNSLAEFDRLLAVNHPVNPARSVLGSTQENGSTETTSEPPVEKPRYPIPIPIPPIDRGASRVNSAGSASAEESLDPSTTIVNSAGPASAEESSVEQQMDIAYEDAISGILEGIHSISLFEKCGLLQIEFELELECNDTSTSDHTTHQKFLLTRQNRLDTLKNCIEETRGIHQRCLESTQRYEKCIDGEPAKQDFRNRMDEMFKECLGSINLTSEIYERIKSSIEKCQSQVSSTTNDNDNDNQSGYVGCGNGCSP